MPRVKQIEYDKGVPWMDRLGMSCNYWPVIASPLEGTLVNNSKLVQYIGITTKGRITSGIQ